MEKVSTLVFAILIVPHLPHFLANHEPGHDSGNDSYVGGGTGAGQAHANGSAIGTNPNGTASATVSVCSVGIGQGNSTLLQTGLDPIYIAAGAAGLGTNCGSAAATGATADAVLTTSGNGTANAGHQEIQAFNKTRGILSQTLQLHRLK